MLHSWYRHVNPDASYMVPISPPAPSPSPPPAGTPAVQVPLNWLNGSLAAVLVFDRVLTAGDIADLYDADSARFEEGLCSQVGGWVSGWVSGWVCPGRVRIGWRLVMVHHHHCI
jgi:hypothetical protein